MSWFNSGSFKVLLVLEAGYGLGIAICQHGPWSSLALIGMAIAGYFCTKIANSIKKSQ